MSNRLIYRGGSSKKDKTIPDTFKSRDTFELILGLGEGPWWGPSEGVLSLYIDQTPIASNTGKSNFSNLAINYYPGSALGEEIKPWLGGFASPVPSSGSTLAYNAPVTRSGVQTEIDWVEIRLLIQALYTSNESSGTVANQAQIKIEWKKTSDVAWTNAILYTEPPAPAVTGPEGAEATYVVVDPNDVTPAVGNKTVVSPTNPGTPTDPGIIWLHEGLDYKPHTWDETSSTWITDATADGDNWDFTAPSGDAQKVYVDPPTTPVYLTGNILVDAVANAARSYNGTAFVDSPGTVTYANGVVYLNEKVTSQVVREFRFRVDNVAEALEYRVTQLTPDSTVEKISELALESISEVRAKSYTFPNTAALQIVGQATDQLSGDPTIQGKFKMRVVRVPSNYNAETRTYTGVWDGTYQMAWTNNPAWVFLDYVENTTFGLSKIFPHVCDKWKVYEWAQNCDVIVDDGRGGTRPRWTWNHIQTEKIGAKAFAQQIAAAGGAHYLDDGNGFVTVLFESPDEPVVALFTNENVSDGMFQYSYTDRLTRSNIVTAKFKNPDLFWRPDARTVRNQADIDTHGQIPEEFEAVGCRSISEALARARLRLVSAQTEKQFVNFETHRKGRYLQAWQLIAVADAEASHGISGVVVSKTGPRTITTPAPVALEPGFTYTLHFDIPNPDYPSTSDQPTRIYEYDIVTAAGTVSSLMVDADLPATLPEFCTFGIGCADTVGVPKVYRVLSIEEADGDPDKVQVTALECNRLKWDYIDGTVPVIEDDDVYPFYNGQVAPIPSIDIGFRTITSGTSSRLTATLTWERSDTRYLRGYEVHHAEQDGPLTKVGETSDNRFIFENFTLGKHTLTVIPLDMMGRPGPAKTLTVDATGELRPVRGVNNLRLSGGGTNFPGTTAVLQWDDDTPDTAFSHYLVEVRNTSTDALLRTEIVTTAREWTYDLDKIRADGFVRAVTIVVHVVDKVGNVSDGASRAISNPAPASPSFSLVQTPGGVEVRVVTPSDADFVGYKVYASTTNGFTPDDGTNLIFTGGVPPLLTGASGSTIYVRVAAYDLFGQTGLNIAAQQSATYGAVVATSAAPGSDLDADFAEAVAAAAAAAASAAEAAADAIATAAAADAAAVDAALAAASATLADADANAAASAMVVATASAAATAPGDFSNSGFRFFTHAAAGTPGADLSTGTTVNVSGVGDVYQMTAYTEVYGKTYVAVGTGRTHKVRGKARVSVNGTSPTGIYFSLAVYSSTFAYLGQYGIFNDTSAVVADGWLENEAGATSAQIIGVYPTAAYVRTSFIGNAGGSQNSTIQLALLKYVDGSETASAAASASVASGHAASASSSASMAASSATLSATFAAGSQGTINSSPTFADNTNAAGVPTNWQDWASGGPNTTRSTGVSPQPYAITMNGLAGANVGIQQLQFGKMMPGWYVIEADAELISGTFSGAGVFIYSQMTGQGDTASIVAFNVEPDINGSVAGAGVTGKIYRWRKLIQLTHATPNSNSPSLYVAAHWESMGSIAAANSVKFHRAAVRAASQAEVEARQAKLDLVTANATIASQGATIASNTSAISTLTNTVSANLVTATDARTNLIPNSTALRGRTGWEGALAWNFYEHPLWGHWFRRDITGLTVSEEFYTSQILSGPGNQYSMSFTPFVAGLSSGVARVFVAFYNSGGTYIGESASVNLTNAISQTRQKVEGIIAPAGTAFMRFVVAFGGAVGASGYAEVGFWHAKIEMGPKATAWRADGELVNNFARLATAEANISTNSSAIATANASIATTNSTVASNFTTVMSPTNNIFPYPSGTAYGTGDGLSTTAQGWIVAGGQNGNGFVNGHWDPAGGAILFESWGSGYSSGAHRYYYIDIPVSYGGNYTASFNGYVSGFNPATTVFYLDALDASNNWLANTGGGVPFSSGGNTIDSRRSITFNTPANTAKVRFVFRIDPQTVSGYLDFVLRALQLERGTVATKFSEDGRIRAGERRLGTAEASIITNASAIATESAARSSLQTLVTARVGQKPTSLLVNPAFSDYPVASGAIPPGWTNWAAGTSSSRGTGRVGAYSHIQDGPAGGLGGLFQFRRMDPGKHNLDITIERAAGTLTGAGVLVEFYNSSDVYITNEVVSFATIPDTRGGVGASVGYDYRVFNRTFTAPAGTYYTRVYLMSHWSGLGSIATYNQIYWHQLDVTPADYGSATVDALATTVATNAGTVATLSSTVTANMTGGSTNLLHNTDWTGNDTTGWYQAWDGNHGLTVSRGIGLSGWSGSPVTTAYLLVNGTPANGTVADGLVTRTYNNLADLKRWAPRVVPGTRIYASFYMGMHRCNSMIIVEWFGADGIALGVGSVAYSTAALSTKIFNDGNPANAERVGGFFTVPANACYAVLIPRMICVGGEANPYLFFGWPMIAIATPGQTVPPPYTPGNGAASAAISDVRTAVVDSSGAYSYYGMKVGAGNRFASIEALASTKTNISQLKMTADKFTVQTATTDKQIFTTSGSLVEINTDLAVGGAITVGSARLKVALESIRKTGADGVAIQWADGISIGNVPEYVLDLSNLAPLTTGEAYNVYLTGVTATGASVYAKISTPGTTSTVTQTTDAAGGGGDPTRVMAKTDSADAYDGVYHFRVVGSMTITGVYDGSLGMWINSGALNVSTWFNDGGGWDQGPDIDFFTDYTSFTDETGSIGVDDTFPITWTNPIGAGGTYDFGVSAVSGGSVSDLHTVSYTKQTSSGVRTASPAGQTVKITAFPRNA